MPDGRVEHAILASQAPALLTIYGIGFAAVFAIFTFLNYHAYRKREELELSPVEIFDTRTAINEAMISGGVALFSIFLARAVPPQIAGLTGFAYFLIGPALAIHGTLRGRRRRRDFTMTAPA
jgi:uncharacterized membrane protein